MELSEERLVLRRCGYWVSLAGQPQSDNEPSATTNQSISTGTFGRRI